MKIIVLFTALIFYSNFLSAQSWKELNDSLIQYYHNGEYEKGINVGVKAIAAAKQEFGEDHANYAESLNNLAVLYQAAGHAEKAEPLLIKVISIQKKVLGENHPDYARALYNLAFLYQETSQYKKAEPLLVQAAEINKKALGETHPEYAASMNNLASLYVDMGLYEKAELLYIRVKEIYKKTLGENDPDYAESLNNLAFLYADMGQYERAEPLYIEAIRINKKIFGEVNARYAASVNNLGALYRAMGQYDKTEPLYIHALEIKKKLYGDKHPEYATSLSNLAVFYQEMGQYEKSEPLLLQALEIRKNVLGETHPDYANSLNNLGVFYQITGQNNKAEPLLFQTIEIRKKVLGEFHPDYATSLNNLAILYQDMGQYGKAEPLLIQALEISRKVFGEMNSDYAESLNNLAVLYQAMGNFEKAEPLYIQAIGIEKKTLGESHMDYALSLDNLSLLYQAMGKYEKAEPLALLNSRIVLENIKKSFTILSEKEKGNYLDNNTVIIEGNNSFLYYNRKASPAFITNNFNLQLFFKSLLLADSRNMMETISRDRDSSLSHLFKEWQVNKSLLAKQYSMPVAQRRQDLVAIEALSETQEKELTRRSSQFRDQKVALQVTMPEVQKSLQQDEAAVEFVRFRLFNKKWTDSIIYAAYVLRKNDAVPVFVPLCEERQLQKLLDSAGNTATSMVGSLYRGIKIVSQNTQGLLGMELYHLIWQPIEPYLKGIKKVAYSPAGKIYTIALQALPVDSVHVLMDTYQLQQFISTRQVALRTTADQTSKPGSIVLFGNASFTRDSSILKHQKETSDGDESTSTSIYTPEKRGGDNNVWADLPGTAVEVDKIKEIFEKEKIGSKSFVQTAATEENLKSLNGHSPRILHIATHGFFLPNPDSRKKNTEPEKYNTYTLADDPLLRSGLMFAGCNYAWSGNTPIDGIEDGIATAYEISQLDLSNTELVVLSACETALGDIKGSEGVFGLQRGFKMAGVKKMIVSLWQVPDRETAELMTNFYTYWINGKSINESFYQAQADLRKKYSAFYWAAFVLIE